MNIFDPFVTGSLSVSASANISGALTIGNNLTVGTISNTSYQTFISTSISDGTLGLDSSGNINALYFLKGGSKKFEVSMDTSATPIFRLLPYTSSGFFEIGNPSNSGTDYVFISEPTYGNVLIGPGMSNATGNVAGSTPSVHKVQVTGSMYVAGNQTLSGYVSASGGFTGSLLGTSTTASYVAGASVAGNISGNAANITAYTINQNLGTTNAVTHAGITNNGTLNQSGSVSVTGSISVTGNITATSGSFTYVQTTYETSSQVYSSGSNTFGNSVSNAQTFTGSVLVTGSMSVTGNQTNVGWVSASLGFTGSLLGTASLASTASYILGSGVSGNISGNATNITAYTINQNLGTGNQVTFAGVTASLQGTASTASYILGSGVSGNISGNAANITAYTINQNLGTGNAVTFAGITSTSNLVVTGSGTFTSDVIAYASSDERLKENVLTISGSLDILKQINGYTFDWVTMEDVHPNKGHDIGVIAQEIEAVLPEIVTTRDNGYKAVKYDKLVALLIETNKELLKRVEALEAKVK